MIIFHSCSNETIAPTTPAHVTLTIESISTQKFKSNEIAFHHGLGSTVDSVKFNRARILLRNVKLRNEKDSVTFLQQTKLIELTNSVKVVTADIQDVREGKYLYLDVDVHKPPLKTDSLPEYSNSTFKEFLEGEHYSIIVDGVVYDKLSKSNFTFKVRAELLSRIIFSPQLSITSAKDITLPVAINFSSWFAESSGLYLNPLDSDNELAIYNNVLNSFSLK